MRTISTAIVLIALSDVAAAHDGHPHVADNAWLHHGIEIGVVSATVLSVCYVAARLWKRRAQRHENPTI